MTPSIHQQNQLSHACMHGVPFTIFLCVFTALSIGDSGRSAYADNGDPSPFAKTVRPFLDAHCVRCHGADEAKSGFRVDDLSANFHADKAADLWKEVMDKINLGEMPPKEQRQPSAAEFEPIVEWINAKLREVELAAKNAGGQIPMRRLNRVEYANSVRDLLHMDPKTLAPLVEELPGDGKAESRDTGVRQRSGARSHKRRTGLPALSTSNV